MNLYLVRHAEAVAVGGEIRSDAERTLSERGRSDALVMARMLAQIDIDIRAVFTSPLVRAVQTGKAFGSELKRDPQISKRLEPGFNPRLLAEEIQAASDGAGIVAIGHQPDMSMFISYLISPAHDAMVTMEPGAMACIHLQSSGQAQLRWVMTPDIVKRMNVLM